MYLGSEETFELGDARLSVGANDRIAVLGRSTSAAAAAQQWRSRLLRLLVTRVLLKLADLLLEQGHLLVLAANEVLVGLQHGLVLLLTATTAVAAVRSAGVLRRFVATARPRRLRGRRVRAADLAQDPVCARVGHG